MSHQASNVDRMVEDGNRVDRGRPLKSPAPAARPAPKVGKFTGERSASRRKSLRFLDQFVPEVPEAAHIEQEKQESTDMSSAEDSCDQYVPPPSADDYSSDDSAVESPSDEEAPPAKKRKEVSNEEKDLLGKFNNR
ncbi:Hypothetical predicted protein [Mytilus galloprovincialis]|uniref:Uncharacterized protein n=1 Tax=Mytilus galloprovincialis TaxID=29158 RepID=A0A8B6HDV7_MYTGA|nr:Hypothetical predicted protein [Mytilus galloprovincialis]